MIYGENVLITQSLNMMVKIQVCSQVSVIQHFS